MGGGVVFWGVVVFLSKKKNKAQTEKGPKITGPVFWYNDTNKKKEGMWTNTGGKAKGPVGG